MGKILGPVALGNKVGLKNIHCKKNEVTLNVQTCFTLQYYDTKNDGQKITYSKGNCDY